MPEALTLHQDYSRKQIHDLFEPGTDFTSGAGSWGLWGILHISARPGNFVLIVSYGRRQGKHTFDEGISTEGILRWQTQPEQGLSDSDVQALIEHNEDHNSVYLFLRTTERTRGIPTGYTYLGRLKYLSHDREREKPVHFAWQLLSWPVPKSVLDRMKLVLESDAADAQRAVNGPTVAVLETHQTGLLVEEAPPSQQAEQGESTPSFHASKRRRRMEQEDRALGAAGERLVIEHERRQLVMADRSDLAEKVVHTAVVEGDGAGFDISSFFSDGRSKYIEVKTTTGPKETDFFISANEVAFAASHPASYELCRVFDYHLASNSGRFYVISGLLFRCLTLTPIQFRVGQMISAPK